MTTDITELAQLIKAAAVRAKTATEEYASGHMSVSVCYAECEEFNRLTDGPDNILALVEALASEKRICATWRKTAEANSEKLEKAQKRISRLESRSVKLPKAMSIEGGAYCSAHAHYDSDGDYYDRTDVEEMLSAAGIKVEAE